MTPPPDFGENLNLRRRPLLGLFAMVALTPLGPLLRMLQRPMYRAGTNDAPFVVFASYMVGDLFMALPALKKLAAARPVRILCRPDCAGLLAAEGLAAIPLDTGFFTNRKPAGFVRTLRAARALRHHPDLTAATTALDLDANPFSALCLRLAGFSRVISYRRAYGALFTETFTLPADAIHQADRDRAIVEYALKLDGGLRTVDGGETRDTPAAASASATSRTVYSESSTDDRRPTTDNPSSPWLLSVWTRKASKNWPLSQWDEFLEEVLRQGVECEVLLAPDGDAAYRAFRARWDARVPFVGGTLNDVAARVRSAAGVIATDNFLGHMAGYYGKPVLWINMCSPAAQVRPRGPHTLEVAPHGTQPGVEPTLPVDVVMRAFAALRGV